jgi:hypothetical protein
MRTGERTVAVKSTRLYTKEELSEGFYTLQRQHRKAEKDCELV